MTDQSYRTPQEAFWAGEFGTAYSGRSSGDRLVASNLHFFSLALRGARDPISSCLELGANVGMNLKALQLLYPGISVKGIEINSVAAGELAGVIGPHNVYEGSIFDYPVTEGFDLVLVKGVLIHINPELLPSVYEKIHRCSKRFVLIAEYYNPAPVAIPYRGHMDRLFKRDFAGDLLESFPDLSLVDYGFVYRRDPAFPQDDVTWFLLAKK